MLLCLDSHYHFSQNFMNGEFSLMWGEADIDEEDLLGTLKILLRVIFAQNIFRELIKETFFLLSCN